MQKAGFTTSHGTSKQKLPSKYTDCHCRVRSKVRYNWHSTIAVAASFRLDFELKKMIFFRQEQKNDLQKFLTPQ